MTARRFRKRPVVIEAMQWDGTRASIEEICRWANEGTDDVIDDPWVTFQFEGTDDVIDVSVATLEGDFLSATPGYWIIKGVQGEFYPCKPDIFDATYEPVDGA